MGNDNHRMHMDASHQCDGKVSFESFNAAQMVLKRIHVKARPARSAYHCVHCQQWHLGTDVLRTQNKRKNEFKNRKGRDE
jgi:hypothetical protein